MKKRLAAKTLYMSLIGIFSGVAVIVCLLIAKYANASLSTDIKFSYESGFYDEPIMVELSVGSSYFITYTLDGRAPNAASTRYESPILINDASQNENVWSSMIETSLRYFEGDEYDLPDYNVDKCSVLRVAAFDYNGNQVSEGLREYFIGYKDKVGYKDMYNLCVVSDPENLFSLDRGIYSAGTYFKGKIESCEIYDLFVDGEGWGDKKYKANWAKTGMKSEIPASIELFNPDGVLVDREPCGVRIYGGISRRDVQKSLRLIAREKYSGKDVFSYDFFGEGQEGPGTFLIHSFSQDCNVKLKDYVVFSALRNGDDAFKYTPTIPCNLFLEGEYWGPMFLMKTLSRETIAENFGIEENNIVLIKEDDEVKLADEIESLKDSEMSRWMKLQEYIRKNDMSNPENYNYVCSQMDVEDFAEYAAIEIYIGNGDWHRDRNYACWRTLNSEHDNPYSDGKWRFCLFDVNWSFIPDEEIWDMTYEDWDFYHMVRCLCQNEEFKKQYLREITTMEVLFSADNVEKIISEWSEIMEEPIRCNYKRFAINADADEEMEKEKELIIKYCMNRPEKMRQVNEWFFSPL